MQKRYSSHVGKIRHSDVEKVPAIFAVNAVTNKTRMTQKSPAFLCGFWDIFAIDSYCAFVIDVDLTFSKGEKT